MPDACAFSVFDLLGSFHPVLDLGFALQQSTTKGLRLSYNIDALCASFQVSQRERVTFPKGLPVLP